MRVSKKSWIVLLVACMLLLLCGLLYKAVTTRHYPPNKSTQRNALSMLQSQDDEQIYEGLRLLSIFQPADALRAATEQHLFHQDPRIRGQAVFLIHRYQDVQAGVSLTKLLDDPDPEVAEEAQRGLHNVNNSLGFASDYQHFEP